MKKKLRPRESKRSGETRSIGSPRSGMLPPTLSKRDLLRRRSRESKKNSTRRRRLSKGRKMRPWLRKDARKREESRLKSSAGNLQLRKSVRDKSVRPKQENARGNKERSKRRKLDLPNRREWRDKSPSVESPRINKLLEEIRMSVLKEPKELSLLLESQLLRLKKLLLDKADTKHLQLVRRAREELHQSL